MQIIEQYLCGKHSPDSCEDGIVVTNHYAAVVDGSTSKTNHQFRPGTRNGRLCMQLVTDFIRSLDGDLSMEEFCEGATRKVRYVYADALLPQLKEKPEERLCASAVVYSALRNEVWMIGDCQCLIDGRLYENNKPYEQVLANKRAALFPQMTDEHPDMVVSDAEGNRFIGHDFARDTILPELKAAMKGENRSYAVIDGFPVFMPGVRRINLDDRQTHEIVLASDGYPFLLPTLRESEDALAKQLHDDPFCINTFKATKGLMKGNMSFDDRAYLRLFASSDKKAYFCSR